MQPLLLRTLIPVRSYVKEINRVISLSNQYESAECLELGPAGRLILGDKPRLPPDSIIGDPDLWHSPVILAEYEEASH